MFDDKDMKIAGDRPSRTIRTDSQPDTMSPEQLDAKREQLDRASLLGASLADKICSMQDELDFVSDMSDALIQRRLLMSFAVSFALDKFAVNQNVY